MTYNGTLKSFSLQVQHITNSHLIGILNLEEGTARNMTLVLGTAGGSEKQHMYYYIVVHVVLMHCDLTVGYLWPPSPPYCGGTLHSAPSLVSGLYHRSRTLLLPSVCNGNINNIPEALGSLI